ncbi:hypothetical protein CsSME_00010151 [Camellia sinensis var. sinensis]
MPSPYEAFATIDSDEHRRRLVQPNPSPLSPVSSDQMALAAKSGSPVQRSSRPRGADTPRTATLVDSATPAPRSSHLHNLQKLQTQIGQLQAQLGSLTASSPGPSSSIVATLAISISTAFHVRSASPSWVLDSRANDHMTGEFSFPSSPVPTTIAQSDLSSKRIFGKGYERDGLYYFGDPPDEPSSSSLASFQVSILHVYMSCVFNIQTLEL